MNRGSAVLISEQNGLGRTNSVRLSAFLSKMKVPILNTPQIATKKAAYITYLLIFVFYFSILRLESQTIKQKVRNIFEPSWDNAASCRASRAPTPFCMLKPNFIRTQFSRTCAYSSRRACIRVSSPKKKYATSRAK